MEHKKKHGFPRSFQNLFHKRQTYSLKPEKNKKRNKLYESINEGTDIQLSPVVSEPMGKARVWSVRNTKSAVDILSIEKGDHGQNVTIDVKAERHSQDTAGLHFDVLSLYKGVGSTGDGGEKTESDGVESLQLQSIESGNDESVHSEGTSERSRLSSVGSSNCTSDTNPSCGSHSSSLNVNTKLTDMNTSYWDLLLPPSPATRQLNACRRFSDSVSSDWRHWTSSPDVIHSLAKRRYSEGPGSAHASWQDKVLHSVRTRHVSSTLYLDETKAGDISGGYNLTAELTAPPSSCHKKQEVTVKRSRSVVLGNSSDKTSSLQRSRSADSRLRKAMQKQQRQRNVSECQFNFSDIESSEESETTAEPKESSESQVASGTDSSSFNSSSEITAEGVDAKKNTNVVKPLNTWCVAGITVENIEDTPGKINKHNDNSDSTEGVNNAYRIEDTSYTVVDNEQAVNCHKKQISEDEMVKEQRAIRALDEVLRSESTEVLSKLDYDPDGNDLWLIEFSDEESIGTDVDIALQMSGMLVKESSPLENVSTDKNTNWSPMSENDVAGTDCCEGTCNNNAVIYSKEIGPHTLGDGEIDNNILSSTSVCEINTSKTTAACVVEDDSMSCSSKDHHGDNSSTVSGIHCLEGSDCTKSTAKTCELGYSDDLQVVYVNEIGEAVAQMDGPEDTSVSTAVSIELSKETEEITNAFQKTDFNTTGAQMNVFQQPDEVNDSSVAASNEDYESKLDTESELEQTDYDSILEMSECEEQCNPDRDNLEVIKNIPDIQIEKCDEEIQIDSPEVESGLAQGLGFHSMSMEDLLFCSGAKGDTDDCDDVDKVFEAINREAGKPENRDKDMMVMFLVGKLFCMTFFFKQKWQSIVTQTCSLWLLLLLYFACGSVTFGYYFIYYISR